MSPPLPEWRVSWFWSSSWSQLESLVQIACASVALERYCKSASTTGYHKPISQNHIYGFVFLGLKGFPHFNKLGKLSV